MTQLLTGHSHLLGKKSWNVYNAENIAKVKHDEAAAAAQENAEEQRMQEVDAEQRLRALRGQSPIPQPNENVPDAGTQPRRNEGSSRKRRRITGEDDTDRDIRFARENNEQVEARRKALKIGHSQKDIPLIDARGHVNLFPVEQPRKTASKNQEAEKEENAKKKSFEDQYTMRFSNAAGFHQSADAKPWYSSKAPEAPSQSSILATSNDVWGNKDLGHSQREKLRLSANDPLAMMQQGVTELRKSERDRQRWNDERTRELNDLKAIARKERKERRRHKRTDHPSHISLSGSESGHKQSKHDRRCHRHRHERQRSASRDAEDHPSRRRSSHYK